MTTIEAPAKLIAATSFEVADGWIHRDLAVGETSARASFPIDRSSGDDLGDWWRSYLEGHRAVSSEKRGPVRTLDLFCGPGGLALGFAQACAELGYEFVSQGAIDDDAGALEVYAANNGTRHRISESVRSLLDYQIRGRGETARFLYPPEVVDEVALPLVGQVDAILAGPPCQGHSNLNNHTRRIDKRNDLYLTVPAFAVAVNASLVVIENVPAVVHDKQNVVATTKTLLEDAGYRVSMGKISADALGWPQTRQRFFLVARKDATPVDLLALGDALADEPRGVLWAIDDLADEPVDGRMVLDVEFSEENRYRIDWLFENDAYDLPNDERPVCHQGGTTYHAVYGRMLPGLPAPTITTGFLTPGRGRYVHPTRRRTLTPHEAARLQGFPDGYDFHPRGDPPSSKAQLTKWIGDAVPMPLGFLAGLSVLGGEVPWATGILS